MTSSIIRFLREVSRPIVFGILNVFNLVVPKRQGLVIAAFPDVEDQGIALLRCLVRESPSRPLPVTILVGGDSAAVRRKLVRLVGPESSRMIVLSKWSWRGIWAYCRSSHVVFTHGLYRTRWLASRQTVVNVWHGMPIKRIWRGLIDSPVPPCTWLPSTSPKFSEVLAAASGLPQDRIPVLGLPRNDLLFSQTEPMHALRRRLLDGVDRVLFFLPTYRRPQGRVGYHHLDGLESGSVMAMSAEEMIKFRALLKELRIRVLVKPHPMSVHYGQDQKVDDHLWIISDDWLHEQGVTLYETLAAADALITDVSSVYVDYLVLNRPVFFYFPDIVEYRRSRTFLLEPVEDWLAGPLCTTAEQLGVEIARHASGQDEAAGRRSLLRQSLNPQEQPNAARALLQHIGLFANSEAVSDQ